MTKTQCSGTVDGRITTALRGCRCVRRLISRFRGEGCAGGRTSHWPRGKRRAHTGRRPRSAHSAVICERGPQQSVRLQPPTKKHALYSEF
ncbi:hypothetical protein EVAR_79634_1 [Eumeta japonica]|uniref:Uncharacterized protein n=1 Tax=Eumeta variegata TaxID=151549 RepID=A0A4C1UF93_EUMVA|nr:hypothetical protein EVAR_79634_1 [Eumeta japonica]